VQRTKLRGDGQPGPLAEIASIESQGNRRTQALAARYESHRRHLTVALVDAAVTNPGRLCLLGSGNGNDVELATLAEHFAEIHLADLDRAAVDRAIGRQTSDVRRRLKPAAPIDLSGMLEALDTWARRSPTLGEIEQRTAAAHEAVAARLEGPFDVVASTCLLTQISWAADHLLGREHPMLNPVREALIAVHLRTLATLVAPGGTALVFSDVLSSRTYPLELLSDDDDLTAVLHRATDAGNFYPGANPSLLRRLPRRDPFLSQHLDAGEWLPPWLWQGPLDRTYLVLAIRFRRTIKL
jgi:hypothetical protein